MEELKVVLLAVKETARAVDVDSYTVMAGATQWFFQWEASDWQVNGIDVWQKED